ncbi:hypothetical protein GCM10023091_09970 [Ravibacter arvi]|uniref:SHSP domain-containing protein n=1 Tax=Ravibacter arvi TaxID=2051041 RepID=A0ABP8LR83_9BACT
MYNKESFNRENQHHFGTSGCGNRFKNRFGHLFGGPWGGNMHRNLSERHLVNIVEKPDHYLLSLYAAGLQKEHFHVSVDEDILTVRYEPTVEQEGAGFIYEEYRPAAFRRSFQLNGKAMTDTISASYRDGVLEVTLPKNPEAHQPAQEINVN